jgi:hypothetical protein
MRRGTDGAAMFAFASWARQKPDFWFGVGRRGRRGTVGAASTGPTTSMRKFEVNGKFLGRKTQTLNQPVPSRSPVLKCGFFLKREGSGGCVLIKPSVKPIRLSSEPQTNSSPLLASAATLSSKARRLSSNASSDIGRPVSLIQKSYRRNAIPQAQIVRKSSRFWLVL